MPVRVVIERMSDGQAVQKVLLVPGQMLRVGRTHMADVIVESDGQMSGIHFEIRTTQKACILRDLNSTNGTWINSQRVQEVILRNGDKVRAGNTYFQVHVDGDRPEEESRGPVGSEIPIETIEDLLEESHIPLGQASFTPEPSRTGLTRYCFRSDQLPPQQLVKYLSRIHGLYLIIDLKRAEMDAPPDLEMVPLFPWLPPDNQELFSPYIVPRPPEKVGMALVEEAWSKDSLVVVFSDDDAAMLVQHLQTGAGAFARPSVLAPQLTEATPQVPAVMMDGVDAVLIESPTAEFWFVLARDNFARSIQRCGVMQSKSIRETE